MRTIKQRIEELFSWSAPSTKEVVYKEDVEVAMKEYGEDLINFIISGTTIQNDNHNPVVTLDELLNIKEYITHET